MFFGQNKHTNIKDFEQFVVTKQEFLAAKEVPKNTILSTMATIYIWQKLQVLHFNCSLKHSNIDIALNFGHVQNKKYHLQTWYI